MSLLTATEARKIAKRDTTEIDATIDSILFYIKQNAISQRLSMTYVYQGVDVAEIVEKLKSIGYTVVSKHHDANKFEIIINW